VTEPTVYVVRHGETAWSRSRQHTGTTDLPLTEEGRREVETLRPLLAGVRPDTVLSSPLSRARETAALCGYGHRMQIDRRLAEWDYGTAEGRTTAEIRCEVPGWSVWTHPIEGGEQLDDVGERVDGLIADVVRRGTDDGGGTVMLFAHAHLLRILAARWCGLPPGAGAHFVLDSAAFGVLGHERDTRCVVRWNVTAW
jgi:probable phosphoglycerate mutase